jgi:hypothetical protein
MPISLTTLMANNRPLFQQTAGPNGAQFTQLHINIINASPALTYYEWAAANNIPVVIGAAGRGTYYGVPIGSAAGTPISLVIDAADFTAVSNPSTTAAQNQLSSAANVVIRGVHEIAHGQDDKDGTPIPHPGDVIATPNATPIPAPAYATPGDYAVARAPTEGASVAAEGRVDQSLIGRTFTVNGSVITYNADTYVAGADRTMDTRLTAIFTDTTLTSVQKLESATIAGTANNLMQVTSTSGSTYLDTNMRDYAARWSGLAPDQISKVTQDDSGHWSVTAVTGSDSVTRTYSPIAPGQTSPTITSERTTSYDDQGFRIEVEKNFETGITTRQSFDAGNVLFERTTSLTNAVGTKIVTTEDYAPNVAAPVKVTITEDSNADGTIDQTTTKIDADHNGIAESTTVAITGGDTTVAVDANQNGRAESVTTTHANQVKDLVQTDEAALAWASISTHYDAQGRADTQVVVNDNGSYYVSDWDQAGTDPNAAVTSTYYDAAGQLDQQVVTHDNGSYTHNDWDLANTTSWISASTNYTSDWRSDSQTLRNRNGSTTLVDWDETNANATSLTQTTIDAQGRWDTQVVVNDNGSYYVSDWDQANANGTVALTTTYYDAQNRQDLQVVTNDNGSYQVTDTDLTNAASWTTATTNYTSDWTADNQTLRNDDGSTIVNDWDEKNANSTAFTTTSYDSLGRADISTTTMDDGRSFVTDYDQLKSTIWDSKTEYFDPSGRLDERVFIYDDKTRVVFDLDEVGNLPWKYTQLNFNAAGVKDYEYIYNDNGSIIHTNWDDTNSQPFSYYTDYFDKSGKLDYEIASLDNTHRVIFDYDQLNSHKWNVAVYDYDSSNHMVSEQIQFDSGLWYQYVVNTDPDTGAPGFTPNPGDGTITDPNPNWVDPYTPDIDWELVYWPLT